MEIKQKKVKAIRSDKTRQKYLHQRREKRNEGVEETTATCRETNGKDLL